MNFKRYSIKEALQTWGGGLSWLAAIMGGWAIVSLWSHFLDDIAMISSTVKPSREELDFFVGGILASWCWICIRAVLSPEPTWRKTLWIATFCFGCWWVGSSPLFDHSLSFVSKFDNGGSPLYNVAHGAAAISLLGSIWLAHPLAQQIQWSQERQAYLRTSPSIWLNRWVLRAIVLVVAVYGGRMLLPLVSRASGEPWQFEPCTAEHVAMLILAALLILVPLRVSALVNRVWFQFLVWPFLLSGLAVLAVMISPEPAEFLVPFIVPFVAVLCVQFWIINFLRFRVVVPRSLDPSSVNSSCNEVRRPVDQKTMALAYVGAITALLACLTGLTVLKKNVCLVSYRIDSNDPWKTSALVLKCQALYLAHPIPKGDVVAWEMDEAPLRFFRYNSIRMLISKSLAQSPGWEEFRQHAEQELPIRFRYVYPISNATEFVANVGGSLIQFDQAKRPLHEYVRTQNNFPGLAKKIVVIGGVVTNADLDLLTCPKLEFVGCHFSADADFYLRTSAPKNAIVFRDCTFEASSFASLTKFGAQQRIVVLTDHERLKMEPALLIDGVLNGIEVEFPNASNDWTPDWLASNRTSRGMFVSLKSARIGLRLGIAPPWDFLLSEAEIPPLLSGKLRTDDNGQIVGIEWDGFNKRDIPTQDPAKLREREFEIPWLAISGAELTREAEPRLATLIEIMKKSRYIEFVDVLDLKSLAKLSQIDFPNETRPIVIQKDTHSRHANGFEHLPWVETVVSDLSDVEIADESENVANAENTAEVAIPDLCVEIAEANVAVLPKLKKIIFLTKLNNQSASHEWASTATGKSITIEIVPSKPNDTWRSSLGLKE
ncbi:MAG: hypothetical protein Q8M16_16955 [Pirellulaceae bacterium]|nr:hypothetical protein [Pirellulaceae bacterium]